MNDAEPKKGIIIDAENETIEVGDVKVKLNSKRFWKYFGTGAAITAIVLGIWSQIGA